MQFEEILKTYNITIAPQGHEHTRSGWIQFDCPFCTKDSGHYRMGYNIHFGYTNCWMCGGHSVVSVLMELTGRSFNQCKRLIQDLDIPRKVEEIKPVGKLNLPPGITELLPAHKKYLAERGFNYKEIQRLWNIKGIGISSGKFDWRIFIPIYYHGKLVSWTTRSIATDKNITRYRSASPTEETIPHKELLYGEDFARHAIIINEGPISAWKIGAGAVSTFGVSYTNRQVLRMIKYPVRAVCFDNEYEAQKRAAKLCNQLSLYPGQTFNVVLDQKDSAEETLKNIRQLRKEILE